MTTSVGQPQVSQQETDQLKGLVETLSAYIEQYHGGAVEMVGYDGHTVRVHMSGACDGCALAPVTLHGWVEGTIRQFFPHVGRIEAV